MIYLTGLSRSSYTTQEACLLSAVRPNRSFWTIVAQGSTPSVQDPLFTLSAAGLIGMSVHALARASAKLARRNSAIDLAGTGAAVRRCAVHWPVGGYVMTV